MAYPKQCLVVLRDIGARFAAARTKKYGAYASAYQYQLIGLTGRANQIRSQADREFKATRENLLDYLETTGCG